MRVEIIEGDRQNQTHAIPSAGVARSREQVEGLASNALGTKLEKTALGLLFFVFERVFLCSPAYPRTHYIEFASLKLIRFSF